MRTLCQSCFASIVLQTFDLLSILTFFFFVSALGIALILTITNAMAFSRCDKFGRANAVAGSFLTSGIFGRLVGLVTGRLF